MQSYSHHPRIAIDIDAALIDWVDEMIDAEARQSQIELSSSEIAQKRTEAIEAAISLWCQQQSQRRLQRSAEVHRQRHDADETGWLV